MSVEERGSAAARRGRLLGIKLRALVGDHLPTDNGTVTEPSPFAPGAALLHDGAAWVLLDSDPESRLGAALAWAVRAGAGELHVIAESGTGLLARRAADFDLPVTVWHANERQLWQAVAEPLRAPPDVPSGHLEFRALIEEGGAEPIVEHGVLAGEVRGLEVCRVVDDRYTGETRLEVGVGAHDREAFTMLHGDVPTRESLARIVDVVARHRRLDAPQHPLNVLGRERLIRWELIEKPERVGATWLATAQPPVPRRNLKDPVPCVAAGQALNGEPVVVVCSVGVDLDLIPYATDARRAAADAAQPGVDAGEMRLVVVTPSRDRVKVTDELAGLLRHSPELVSFT